jgi:hypothetical protein
MSIMTRFLLALVLVSPALAQNFNSAPAIQAPNDTTTGTIIGYLAVREANGDAISATAANTGVQAWIVTDGGGIAGNASLAFGGKIGCYMDASTPSIGGAFVILSTIAAPQCHAQTAAPGSGVAVVGYLAQSSTTINQLADVQVDPFIYSASSTGNVNYSLPGAYSVNQGTNGSSDAIQTFPADNYHASLVIGNVAALSCCSNAAGEFEIGPPAYTNSVPHGCFNNGANIWYCGLTQADTVTDFAPGSTGITGSPTVLQLSPAIVNATLYNPVTNNLSVQSSTGNLFDLQPGIGLNVAGSLSSGSCIGPNGTAAGEVIAQAGGGSSTFVAIEPNGSLQITSPVTGTANAGTNWVGATSGCVFAPTAVPATPYLQFVPVAGHIRCGYGSDSRFQCSNSGAAFSDTVLVSDSPTGPASNYSNATTTLTTVITSATIPAGATRNYDCYGWYNFTTTAEKIGLAITTSQTPQSIFYGGTIAISTAGGGVYFLTPATASATIITSGAVAAATGVNYAFEVHGTVVWNATTAGTFTLQAQTSSASGTVNIPANSTYCRVN